MKEIKNEKEEINKDECMNDEDLLNDIMLCEKNISNSYSVAINEMSNKYLYKKIMNIFEDTKDLARDIFNLMFSKGWYILTPEEENKITKSYTKYSDKLKELS
jgi:spore coat protein CotF